MSRQEVTWQQLSLPIVVFDAVVGERLRERGIRAEDDEDGHLADVEQPTLLDCLYVEG